MCFASTSVELNRLLPGFASGNHFISSKPKPEVWIELSMIAMADFCHKTWLPSWLSPNLNLVNTVKTSIMSTRHDVAPKYTHLSSQVPFTDRRDSALKVWWGGYAGNNALIHFNLHFLERVVTKSKSPPLGDPDWLL
jgi:hypothetical protein